MIDAYSKIDAVLFLSKTESYGFPLVEAMFVGLPIVCPDLPYAHTLCGDQAIYFDPDQPDSLREALFRLHSFLEEGWWPDWRERMSRIPKDWQTVARRFLEVACK
jgi:glycosyltransferase involved in cell wall biosynthesis